MATPIDVVVLKCRKISPTGNRRNRALLLDKKFLASPQTVAIARIASKSVRAAPTFGSRYSRFQPNRFTFGGIIADRVKAVLLAYRANP